MKIGNINIDTFPISQVNMKGLMGTIYSTPITFSICPCCEEKLKDYTYAIPLSNTDCVRLHGLACHKCDTFFSDKPKLIRLLDKKLVNNPICRFCYDFDVQYNAVYYTSIFSKLKSAYCQITVCAPGKIRTYTIVASEQDIDSSKCIFHYTDRIALELLTAVILGNKNIRVGADNLIIERVRIAGSKQKNDVFHILNSSSCVEVVIKKNGGYYDCNESVMQVHGLVFCENSKCLELIPMSYNKEWDMYYVDSQIYNRFRKIHGFPIVNYVSHSKEGQLALREESLLHRLGYNVNLTDNLSDATRYIMLASFVDLGFISVPSIVKLLTHLINLNGKTRKSACEKWKKDLAFIENYRFDPDRFAFVSRIRRL